MSGEKKIKSANQEIGGPSKSADQEIGGPHKSADQEIGGPHKSADQEIGGPHKSADQEIGGPSGVPSGGPRGWHSRGYIPHFDSVYAIQHVTFHLADSLPKDVLERLRDDLKMLPAAKQDAELRKRIEEWMDAGHGSCVLRIPEIAAMVQSALMSFDGQRYRLLEWVVMPNHVHVLFQPMNEWSMAKIVASWKKFTARKICEFRRIPGNAILLNGDDAKKSANQEIGDPRSNPRSDPSGVPRVWHREYWDRFVRNEEHLCAVREYINQNPVKAGLVERSDMWEWGSAKCKNANQELPGNANLPIGVTGKSADQELPGNANLPVGVTGKSADQEIGVPGNK